MDGENEDRHDRTVARALVSLTSTTAPTAAERQRIRDRILLALEDPAPPVGRPSPGTGLPPDPGDPAEFPRPADESAPRQDDVPAASGESHSAKADDEPHEPGASGAPSPGAAQPARGAQPGAGRTSVTTNRPPGRREQRRPARDARPRGLLAGVRGRFAVAAIAVLALGGSLLGMSVLLARDALPGDALYGVKRSAEAAELGLTFGDEPKALKHLEFAASRVSEIEVLARQYPDPAAAPVGGYLTALTDFDNDATAGSRQLITLATSTDGRLLDSLRAWSTQQASRLGTVAELLPEAARNRQAASHALLDRITARADGLLARLDCAHLTSGSHDDIGALPATTPCEPRTAPGRPEPTGAPPATDVPGPGTEVPGAPSSAPATPGAPLVPLPGQTATPLPDEGATPPSTGPSTPPPLIQLPPLLPGLPGLSIG